ncbi:MAG TPA: choice-of-anchor D domain-containing protein, partial [Polyangiaceae bacterium]
MSKVSPVRALFGALLVLCALLAAIAVPSCLSTNGTNLFPGGLDASFDAGPGVPVVSVNGATQGFGSISLGASSAPTTIVVTNTGTAATGTLHTALGGADPDSFSIDSDTCAGQVLAAGTTCTVTLHFTPKKAGALTATFTISATPGGSLTVQLSGQSSPPGALTITPSTNDFGSIVAGVSSSATPFTVTNTGGSDTGMLTAALSGTDQGSFTIASDTCTGSTLAAGATCAVGVTFAPTAAGTKAASLTVAGTPGGAASAALGGTAITGGVLSMAPATQDFGSAVVGATSAPQTFTVTNTGGAPTGATFSSGFTGTNGAEFSVSANTCSGVLAPGGNCTFTVVFKPSASGAKTATFTVGAAPGGTVSSSLTAIGLSPAALSIAPAANDFGSVIVGQQSTDATLVVTNSGQSPSGTLTVSEAGAGFAVDAAKSNCGAALAPNQSCNVAVYFKPTSAITFAGTITVQGTPGGKVSANVTGTGLTPGALSITPATFTFANTLLNQTSAAQTFTVSNTGGGATGTLAASITGSGASQFNVGTDGCSAKSLAGAGSPGASCTVTV